ncbi:ABC transporter ATP-binding protein [Paenibacillus sp. JCM 10914]|uniref:ATP-binding cassette domain-containing protein n=1 Tax=Paenibacillus sp. JCM 10914 TaxID=1236974 RepID=UPI0003CC37F6|nr:ABC transporter ATP-binding protein [Paenibacillus sp. JCM 10914]GAE08795.1 ABC-type multidrug transport system, ATPase component [Paenibacillus sp. JCM 10914]
MQPILETKGLTKTYMGGRKALHDVNIQIGGGKIIGLLGTNGSGKSTFMKIAAGLAQPSSGTIQIKGMPVGLESKKAVSFMPDRPVTESWMSVADAVAFFRDFYEDFNMEKANSMLQFMNLNKSDRIGALSKGMNERLQLTLALSRDASLYMLDEPIGGVDPVARGKILDAIVEFYNEDSSILISTHLVRDIERIFDEVIFIRSGEVVLHDEVENIRLKHGKSVDDMFKEVYAE